VDILVAAYWKMLRIDPQNPADPLRDRFILSKGHAASALYATLASRGFFPTEWLDTFGEHNSRLSEHPKPKGVPGVELATGSLGHGLGYGAGLALAGRIQKQTYRVVALMSDGECDEGSVWEAAMFIPAHKLDNMAVIVDYNKWQATGRSNEVMALAAAANPWPSSQTQSKARASPSWKTTTTGITAFPKTTKS
jgi:transketolase